MIEMITSVILESHFEAVKTINIIGSVLSSRQTKRCKSLHNYDLSPCNKSLPCELSLRLVPEIQTGVNSGAGRSLNTLCVNTSRVP